MSNHQPPKRREQHSAARIRAAKNAEERQNVAQHAWHAMSREQAIKELDTFPDGLSPSTAHDRLAEFGPNELNAKPPRTLANMVREQLSDPMILILLTAAALSALLQEWVEAGIIAAIVVVNAVIGIVQEQKAQSSLEALRSLSAPEARVMRGGIETVVPARDLVPGDLVLLGDGSMAPADLRLTSTAGLRMQEAALTGESVPTDKNAASEALPGAPLGDRANMAFATAIVTAGRGEGVVVATGMNTEVGRIAGMLEESDGLDTPIKRKLASFGKGLTIVGVVAALAVIAIGLAYGRPLAPLLLLAVSLAISVIPESLPATATVTMALGVQRMAQHEALVRRLPAVETLGGATVICTDKTGTLTENRMNVVRVALGPDLARKRQLDPEQAREKHARLFEHLAFTAVLCNDAVLSPAESEAVGDTVIGDPTEGALLLLARDGGIDPGELRAAYPRLAERPFDSDRKRMSTVNDREGQAVVSVKGALDSMLPRCAYLLDQDGPRPLTDEDREHALALAQTLSDEALRVLAFATRALAGAPDEDDDIERDLVLIGIVGMMDPPRPDVRHAVETCRTAGVRTVMITGDHAATARAIGRDLGIHRPGDLVVTGEELDRMDDEALDEAVKHASIFARVSPLHKLRIVRALQHGGEVTAMTGDGVNDAPALKAADIGVAMGITGTDVAKDASDMILMDDRFTTIVYAVREGRRVFRNIQKVVAFLVADNVAQIIVLLTALALNWNAPLTAVMILWVNLATASLPALALGVEPASRHIMEHPPMRANNLLDAKLARRVGFQGVFIAVLALAAFAIGREAGGDALGCTMAFGTLAFSQVLRALNQRSTTDPVWDRGETRNPQLAWAVGASFALMMIVLLVPPIIEAFGGTSMNASQWALVGGFALLSVVQTEIAKAIGRWRAKS
ncbi:MAG: Calcium-transporting ATPase 1 [Paraeggerthella hongkongensis]|uniref:cation-translocating P-type ATPase n=1 Tax=Paraeggerthella sp. TaxID=2897350 RepID=UPI0030E121F4